MNKIIKILFVLSCVDRGVFSVDEIDNTYKKEKACWKVIENSKFILGDFLEESPTKGQTLPPEKQGSFFRQVNGNLEKCKEECAKSNVCQIVQHNKKDEFCWLNEKNLDWSKIKNDESAKGYTIYAYYSCNSKEDEEGVGGSGGDERGGNYGNNGMGGEHNGQLGGYGGGLSGMGGSNGIEQNDYSSIK